MNAKTDMQRRQRTRPQAGRAGRQTSLTAIATLALLIASGAHAETLIEAGITYDSGCRDLDAYYARNGQLLYDEEAQNTAAMLSWLRLAGMPSVGQVDADTSIPMIKDECRQHPEETIQQVVTPIVIGAEEFRLGATH